METTPLGGVRPCCLYKEEIPDINLKTHTMEQAFHSEYMDNLRKEFEDGGKPAGCERCWMEEDAGKTSKRMFMLKKFKDYTFDTNLIFLDLKLGNICNLQCRICGAWSSSKWAQEDITRQKIEHPEYKKPPLAAEWLRLGQWPRRSPDFWSNMDELLPGIKYFEFTGGEPFLIKQHFDLLQRAVERGYSNEIDIHYNTNGTQFPKQHEVWRHFKHVQIAFSIDNTGKRFEYERYGAKWRTVNRNIKRFLELKEQGYPLSFQICITWNIQNTWYISDILKWAKSSGIDDIHFNLMHDPEEFSLTHLPETIASELYKQLDKAIVKHPEFESQIRSLKTVMNLNTQTWGTGDYLRQRLRQIDVHRNVNFAETHPEVAQRIGYEK